MPSLLLALSLSLSSAAFSQISWSLSSLSPHSHLISLKIVISLCLNCSPKAIILCPTSTLWPVLWHSAPECLFPLFSKVLQINSSFAFLFFFNYSTKKASSCSDDPLCHFPQAVNPTLFLFTKPLHASFYISLNQRKNERCFVLAFMFVLLQNAHGGDKRMWKQWAVIISYQMQRHHICTVSRFRMKIKRKWHYCDGINTVILKGNSRAGRLMVIN